jgi:hypothetical protein
VARVTRRRRLVAATLVASAGFVFACLAFACTEGVTPDCSGANAAACGPSLVASDVSEAGSIVLPEASAPLADAGDAGGDAARRDAARDGGDGG